MSIKLKPDKVCLKETAEQAVKLLEAQRDEYLTLIDSLQAKIDEVDRKVRWLKREIIE